MDPNIPSAAIIQAITDPNFNGMIIEAVLCGAYTLIFTAAIFKLYAKIPNKMYLVALILLWVSVILSFSDDWVSANSAFVKESSTPLEIAQSVSSENHIVEAISTVAYMFISDAILIWRCHALWRNKKLLIVLLGLLVTVTGLTACNEFLPDTLPVIELIGSLGTLCSIITTIAATSLIALKISRVTRESHSSQKYSRVIMIAVESAALVAIVQMGWTILVLINYTHPFDDLDTSKSRGMWQLMTYIVYMQTPAAGLAPTLIAFRVTDHLSPTEVNSVSQASNFSRMLFRRAPATAQGENPAAVSALKIRSGCGSEDDRTTISENHLKREHMYGEQVGAV